MKDIEREGFRLVATIMRADGALAEAKEAFQHACLEKDWDSAALARRRAMDALAILLNAIEAAHRFGEGKSR